MSKNPHKCCECVNAAAQLKSEKKDEHVKETKTQNADQSDVESKESERGNSYLGISITIFMKSRPINANKYNTQSLKK
ncbi:hypothetical protein AVEN_137426-1 [Araneus ventricosus]|uniref:Uncharacterized protein n=1 Tax=Araneus ventricosus TaxID=182803 RepID=A0A4Y2H9S9_ARAVE|nr:hypothetical protein AVEN_137426-1 [Araneus ventricosus]